MRETTRKSRLVEACLRFLDGHIVILSMWVGVALAQEVPSQPVPSSPRAKKFDLMLSGQVMGLFPQDKDLSVGGSRTPQTDVRGTIGAGIKFDACPWFILRLSTVGTVTAPGISGLARFSDPYRIRRHRMVVLS